MESRCSAGIAGPTMPVADYPAADWRRVIEVDLDGAFDVNKAAVRRMIAQMRGPIVDIASVAVSVITPAAARTRILEQVPQAHIDDMPSKIPRGRATYQSRSR